MRRNISLLTVTVVLLATSAARAQPGGGRPAQQKQALERAEKLLEVAGVALPREARKRVAAARAAGKVDEKRVVAALEAVLARCLAADLPCWTAGSKDKRLRRVVRALLTVLGALGTARSFPLLWRLDARQVIWVGPARQKILARAMEAAIRSKRCTAPTAAEVAAARKGLADFLVIAVRSHKGKLAASKPTVAELNDLAYFLAATTGAGPVVGSAREQGSGSWRRPGPRNRGRSRMLGKLNSALRRGHLALAERLARTYLQTLGYPGPIRTSLEHNYSFGGPMWARVMRDLALLAEARGAAADAARLYRRAPPGGGACGTGDSSRWERQVKGLIRAGERMGRCRAVVPERLLELRGHGTARLAAAGFDVPRLYRGALVTRHRDLPLARLRDLLRAAPGGKAALARLAARGAEAWEWRVYAVEGLADSAQAAALPVLTRLALGSAGKVRLRALDALGRLTRRPERDPCARGLFGTYVSTWSSIWSRSIRALGRSCKARLPDPAAAALAGKLLPLLAHKEGPVRAAAARALGALGRPSAREPLERLLQDPFQAPGVKICPAAGKGPCRPSYPVRKAAREALARVNRFITGSNKHPEQKTGKKKKPHGKKK